MKDVSKVIGQVTKLGGKLTENVTIKSCTIANRTPGHEAVTLELNQVIPTISIDEDGKSVVKNMRHPYVRTFGITEALPDTEEGAMIKKTLVGSLSNYPETIMWANCDILSIPVKADTEFLSPFSDDPKPYKVTKDGYYHYLINLKLGKLALQFVYDMEASTRDAKIKANKEKVMREYEELERERNAFRNKLRSIVAGTSDDTDKPEDDTTE